MNNWYDLWPTNIYQLLVALDVLQLLVLLVIITTVLVIGRED